VPVQPESSERRTSQALTPAVLMLAAGLLTSHLTAVAQADAPATDSAPASSGEPGEQPDAAAAALAKASPAQLLEDFNFYVNIANVEMAKANATALLDKASDPRKFLAVVEDSATLQQRFDEAYRRAILNKDLEPYAAQLWMLYEEGRRLRARDPKEIDANIAQLTGNSRARLLAAARLKEAKEYAVPQLLAALTESKDPVLQAESRALLQEMGRDAVMPLCAALANSGSATQDSLCRLLANIQYPSALPYLYELKATTTNAATKEAAASAIARITGADVSAIDRSASEAFRELGERYLAASPSLTIFAGEPHQLAWGWVKGVGINPQAIRSEVFPQTMAMALAEKSLALDPSNTASLSLWLAANFSRQLNSPEGYENPLYPSDRRDPMYYAVAAGSGPVQSVLARALDLRDTRLARKAIAALDMNMASAAMASDSVSGGRPLVECLSYPDRRVQFEAAMAIAKANPTQGFEGAERVVPTLAAAIRDAGALFASVIARDPEQQQAVRAALEADGYTVIKPAFDLSQAMESINQAPGVDLIVVQLPAEAAAETIDQVRSQPRLRAAPVLAMMSLAESNRIASRFASDALTRFSRDGLDAKQVAEAARSLTDKASGPRVSADETRAYSLASLARLTDLAISGNATLDVADATTPLIAALATSRDEVRLQVAGVLARINRPQAQVALMDAAVEAAGDERVALLTTLTGSAKRFGNLLEERQVKRLVELVQTGKDAEATAAAALMGALNLPNTRLVPLVTGK